MRRRALATLPIAAILLVGTAGAATPAPAPDGPVRPPRATDPPPVDRDGDRVGDDLAARIAEAASSAQVDVIVRGARVGAARRHVGDFAVRHDLAGIDGFSARMRVGQVRALAGVPGVLRVDAVRTVRLTDTGTDRDFGAALARSAFSATGAGVGICVIDTGVDRQHEQIAPRTVTFRDFIGTATEAYDDHGHGTHVASIAAGDGNGGPDAASHIGVAPEASLYAAKVLDSGGSGANDGVLAGMLWCADDTPARVLSMSLGDSQPSDGSDPMSAAVDSISAAGKVVVVAAGNAGDAPSSIPSPGAAKDGITVGAVSDWSATTADTHDAGIALAPFSSRGPIRASPAYVKPDVVAPGVTVSAAQAGSVTGYVSFSGTSMATPYVAGVVALGLQLAPGRTPAQVRAALEATARDRGPVGKDNDWGAGLVDAEAFVQNLSAASNSVGTPFPTFTHGTGSVPDGGSSTLAIPVTDASAPLSVTVTITSGSQSCQMFWPGYGCVLPGEWSPDLDVELRDKDNVVVARSECALSGWYCTAVGRQETVMVDNPVNGPYSLRVFAWNGGPGGTFTADVSSGPVTGSAPPAPENLPPTANAGQDQTKRLARKATTASFTLDGRGSSDPEGLPLSYAWTVTGSGITPVSNASPAWAVSLPVGTYTATLVVTDSGGLTSQDTATLTVRRR